ncbi:sugar porter family MFS transporter [Rhodococcus triatomae]|uniref:Predicted arabinose efflux permease, MFS family n=1 Tax=Rhodococcus triatomae TaxID=300028 RepID=A0A1G8B544_9NOCA|nr:MFS transporter [Rhodococcus triatomae]QNG17583.1 sugar porter family MFS transporter [Rhodococcus triatomae]QNG22749.1 sugar porter family MFS transporter [Rhodococcus triatomae]SDH28123.1 Predicted arabinose efflux permease, MFS family [Rhodococcus triatomae]
MGTRDDRSTDAVRRASLVAAAAAVGGFLFGADTSTMNGAINGIQPDFGLASSSVGAVVAISILGCALGAFLAGRVSARIGQTATMRLGGVLVVLGSLAAALAWNVVPLGLCRIVCGVGIGLLSVIVPGYIAEIAPESVRGRLGSFWQLAIVIGIFTGLLADYVLNRLAGGAQGTEPWGGSAWRWMFVAVAVAGAVYLALVFRLTDSGHHEKRQAAGGGMSLLRGTAWGLAPIVWVGIGLAALQQLVGINVIFFYSTTLWQSVGFSEDSAFLTGLFTAAVNIAATVGAVFLVDRLGRRPLLIGGSAGITVTLATLAVCFSTAGDDGSLPPGVGVVALIAANLFVVFFGLSWGPLMWVVLGEIFEHRMRAVAMSLTVMVNWLTNWLVTRTFPSLADLGLPVAYALYAGFGAFAVYFTVRYVRETKGKVLD